MAWQFVAGEILTAANLNAVTLPWNAICITTRATTQSISNNTTTTINWNLDELDPRGWHDEVSPQNRVTPDEAGYYRASYMLNWEDASDYTRFEVNLNVTGGTQPELMAQQHGNLGGAGGGKRMSGAFPPAVFLDGVDDFVELSVNQVNGAAASRTVTGIFSLELIYSTA